MEFLIIYWAKNVHANCIWSLFLSARLNSTYVWCVFNFIYLVWFFHTLYAIPYPVPALPTAYNLKTDSWYSCFFHFFLNSSLSLRIIYSRCTIFNETMCERSFHSKMYGLFLMYLLRLCVHFFHTLFECVCVCLCGFEKWDLKCVCALCIAYTIVLSDDWWQIMEMWKITLDKRRYFVFSVFFWMNWHMQSSQCNVIPRFVCYLQFIVIDRIFFVI